MSQQFNTANKSRYGSKASNTGADKKSSTTHYAYRLERDGEGNVTGKEFINNMQIFENEGQYGKYLKVRVTGPIPADDLFIAKKREK